MDQDFRKLHRDVALGNSQGRIIWQPRIACWYHDKVFAGQPLPPPYAGMDLFDIYRRLRVSARLYEKFNHCFIAVEPESVQYRQRQLNERDTETTIVTPAGKQVFVNRRTDNSPRPIRLKWEIETEDELKAAIWRVEHTQWRWDQQLYEELVGDFGDLGAPTMFMPRVTLQDLYINRMGVEKASYALCDWPDTVKAYFTALDDCHDRLIDVINSCPIDIINFGDNLHCGTLPPRLFVQYVLPAYQRRCEKLHRAGKFISAHWDGDTKSLLPYARETGLDAIEAITPQPQGDVTLEEVKAALGDDIFLLDGVPALLFNEYYSVEALEECVRKIIDLFAPRLILGISDELSSMGQIERVALVRDMVEDYNGRLK